MKFVHAADLHLDSPLVGLDRYDGVPVDAFRGATRRACERLVDLCLEEAADFLLIAGDLYDGNWKDYRTGLFFAAQMARLNAAGIPVFLVRGNHDAASEITRHLRLPGNVRELTAARPESDVRTLERLGVAVHGQGFARREVTDDLAARYPAPVPGCFNIGLLHTALDGREGHDPYAPTTLAVLRNKGYDYWALGHVHRREVVSEAPHVVFPGNLQGRHARETGAKGATVVVVEDGRVAALEPRALDHVRWARVEVDVEASASGDDAVDRVREALRAAVLGADGRALAVRVVLAGRSPAHAALAADPERWTSEVRAAALDAGEGAVWVEKVTLGTRSVVDLEAVAARDDAVGQLVRGLREVAGDAAALAELQGELDELRRKLPVELREGVDGLRLDDPAFLRALVGETEQLLVPLLLDRADPP